MRNHSGHDVNGNGNLDKSLKDHEGSGGPATLTDDDFSVATDHDQQDGERSPSKQGRGESASADDAVGEDD